MKILKTADKDYQYAEAKPKDAAAYRSFGWQIKKSSLRSDANGGAVIRMRRYIEYAQDAQLMKLEKTFNQNNGKGLKILKRNQIAKQFFAILFAVLGIGFALLYLLSLPINQLADITANIDVSIKNILVGFLPENVAIIITLWTKVVAAAIGVISFAFIFINKASYARHRVHLPKRLRKYDEIAVDCIRKGGARVVWLKRNNAGLQTKMDRELFSIEETANRTLYSINKPQEEFR